VGRVPVRGLDGEVRRADAVEAAVPRRGIALHLVRENGLDLVRPLALGGDDQGVPGPVREPHVSEVLHPVRRDVALEPGFAAVHGDAPTTTFLPRATTGELSG